MILPKKFFLDDTVTVARNLLGAILIHDSVAGRTAGRIVETEAYLYSNDPACHAHKGKTQRNAVMFGPPSHAYIYFIYGMYHCFNVVTAAEGIGEAVLIRALEPLDGIDLMRKRRRQKDLHSLCSGPGKLVQAMGMTSGLNGCSLLRGALTIHSPTDSGRPHDRDVIATCRIGITHGAELPLRFYIKYSPFASRPCVYGKAKSQ